MSLVCRCALWIRGLCLTSSPCSFDMNKCTRILVACSISQGVFAYDWVEINKIHTYVLSVIKKIIIILA